MLNNEKNRIDVLAKDSKNTSELIQYVQKVKMQMDSHNIQIRTQRDRITVFTKDFAVVIAKEQTCLTNMEKDHQSVKETYEYGLQMIQSMQPKKKPDPPKTDPIPNQEKKSNKKKIKKMMEVEVEEE